MSSFWLLPVLVVVIGMGVLTVYVRALGSASDDLRRQFDRFAEVRVAVDELRVDAALARAGRTRR